MKLKIRLLTLGMLFTAVSFAQVIDFKNDKYWINAGLGAYYAKDKTDGFTWNIQFNLNPNKTIYKINFLHHQEFSLFGPDPLENFYHLGMLIGKNYSVKYAQIGFSIGIGATGGVKRGKLLYTEEPHEWFAIKDPRHFENERFFTPSIPLEIDLTLIPVKFLGAGVSVYGDLNFKKPMYGFTVRCGLGQFR